MMHFDLKPLHPEAIPAALEKSPRYQPLNEPEQAESICEDVLRIDADNQLALTTLLLPLTDRFGGSRPVPPRRVRNLLPRLRSEYERAYLAGIIAEREGLSWMRSVQPRRYEAAYVRFREAMKHYEKAENLRPAAYDDAILRWNCCARITMNHPDVAPTDEISTRTHVGD